MWDIAVSLPHRPDVFRLGLHPVRWGRSGLGDGLEVGWRTPGRSAPLPPAGLHLISKDDGARRGSVVRTGRSHATMIIEEQRVELPP